MSTEDGASQPPNTALQTDTASCYAPCIRKGRAHCGFISTVGWVHDQSFGP